MFPSSDAPGFSCVSAEYEHLDLVLVRAEDQGAEKYGRYSLSFLLDDIGTRDRASARCSGYTVFVGLRL